MMTKQCYCGVASVVTLVLLMSTLCVSEELLQTRQGSIGAGNYTFFKIRADGYLRIELISIKGDADIYLSDIEREPRYYNYKIQSCTYGIESVEIAPTFKRPINVGVYGHPSVDLSKFQLSVYILPEPKELSYHQFTLLLNNYNAIDKLMYGDFGPGSKSTNQQRPGSSAGFSDNMEEDEDEGSLIWQVFITLFKVILEVLL